MTEDPFSDYGEALFRLVEGVRAGAATTDRVSLWDLTEEAVEDFEVQLEALAEHTWSRRQGVEAQIGHDQSRPLSALDSMLGVVAGACRLLSDDRLLTDVNPPEVVRYATVMLMTRALSVGNEISALVRAGFPVGARARWRTLYELDVVAAILLAGNRGTAARYINHRWVIVAKRHEEFFRSEAEWAPAAPEVLRMARKFTKRYGEPYQSTYGWAAELAHRRLGVDRPQWRHLVKIANLRGHEGHVAYANRAIHADAIGGLLNVDDSGLFHAGALNGHIASVCLATIRVLGEIIDSTIRTWSGYSASETAAAPLALCDEICLILQRQCLETGTVEIAARSADVAPASPRPDVSD